MIQVPCAYHVKQKLFKLLLGSSQHEQSIHAVEHRYKEHLIPKHKARYRTTVEHGDNTRKQG